MSRIDVISTLALFCRPSDDACAVPRYDFADKGEELDKLWEARRGCYLAAMSFRDQRGDRVYLSDTCVPLSHIAQMVSETEADFKVGDLTACF